MSKYIKFNKLNKYFKFILLIAFFRFFNDCVLGYNYNNSFEDISLIKFIYSCLGININNNILNSMMVELFFNYIGTLIFSFLIRIYELKIAQKKIKYFFNFNVALFENQRQLAKIAKGNEYFKIKENILSKFKNYLLNNTSFVLYIIISFIWVTEEITMFIISDLLRDLDFWFFEIYILIQIYSKIFLVEIYRHQYFAIFLNLFPSILKIIGTALTLSTNEDIIYNRYKWWIFVGFFIFCLLTAINSFIYCSIKSLLDLKYTTISHILIFYSSLGILISFLISIFSTYFPCTTSENINYFTEKMCKIIENNYTYFDSYKIYFNSFSEARSSEILTRTFIIILDALTFSFKTYFLLLSIQYTDPVHAYFNIPIYYIFQKIVLIINNAIVDKKAFLITSNYKVAKYCLDISGDFFCLIGFLVYLEIIELNFFGLNRDLKKYITQRSKTEDMLLLDNLEDEKTEEKDEESSNNKSIEMFIK